MDANPNRSMRQFSKRLRESAAFILHPTPPFHFDGTVYKPSHFPSPLEVWEPGRYWHSLRLRNGLYGVRLSDLGTAAKPAVGVTIFSEQDITGTESEMIRDEVVWRFDLIVDLREFLRAGQNDPRFRKAFRSLRGMRASCPYSLYELVIICVLLQNATVRRTVQMTSALLDAFGTELRFDSRRVFAMWRPADLDNVSEAELRALKIGYRVRMLKRLSQDFARGAVDEFRLRTLDLDSAKNELMKLYGVGPETARILMYSACHQSHPLLHIAPWQQKIYSRLFYDKPLVPARRILRDLNDKFRDRASLAVDYAWEDLFWRHRRKPIDWLQKEIRL